MNLNISPSPFDVEQINEYQDHNPHFSCRVFFDSTDRDRTKYYNDHLQLYQTHPHYHSEDDYSSYHGGSPYEDDTNNKVDNGLKLTLWDDPLKWKPSRVEPMRETKMDAEEDQLVIKKNTSARSKVCEDQKLRPSSSLETDLSSNSCCNIVTITPTIRVCSDCNTTKTPLWRSGPKGPKSLCNACGIRQRKARRAMAAAAAAAAATTGIQVVADAPPPVLKIKVQQQNKQKISKFGRGQDSKFKKRSKITAAAAGSSSSNVPKKLNFEDFLIKLSKNLSFHRVFPQDEKDAAILLMALSSGLVHG